MIVGEPLWFADVGGFGVVEWEVRGTCSALFQNGARVRMTVRYAEMLAAELKDAVAAGRIVDALAARGV